MGKNFLKEWKLKLSDMSIYAAIEIALFILGVCSQYVSRRYDNNLPLGTLMAALSVGFILLLGFLFDFYMGFHLAVSYGKTRKNFLLSVLPTYVSYGFLFAVTIKLLLELETILWRIVGEGKLLEWPYDTYASVGWLPTYVSYGFLFAVTIKLLLELETILWRIVGEGKLLEWPYDTYASVGWLLLYAILLTGLSVSMGTIICRFKTKGAVALLIIWILLPFMERFGLVSKLLYAILLTGLSVSMGTIICRFKTKGAVALLIIWILLPFMERFGLVSKGEIEKFLTGLSVSMGTIICRFKTKGAVALLIIWILLPFMERFGLVSKGEIEKLVLGFFTWNPGIQAGVFLAAGMLLCLVPFLGLRNAQVN